ncbi:MAG TPA: hypothetical protein EYG74_00435 [Sulfurimonas autotrophica]|nr:hypothetical protein [Sulfurimonas autotrophica]
MVKFFYCLVFVGILTGCTVDNSGTGGFDVKEPTKEKRTKYRTFISDEELKTQKELAQIEAQKRIELEKISGETRLKQLELEREKELALLHEKEKMLKIEHEQAMQRYMLIGAIILILLTGAALLWYFDKRRKDKLRAYEDNLKKYFHQKENEARVKIAEKILDTVASQDLNIEQKTKLIEALHGPMASNEAKESEDKQQLQERYNIEDKSDDDTIIIEPQENENDSKDRK